MVQSWRDLQPQVVTGPASSHDSGGDHAWGSASRRPSRAGGIGEHDIGGAELDRRGVADPHRAPVGEAEGGQVGAQYGRGHGVPLHGQDLDAGPGKAPGVAADAGARLDQLGHPARGEPPGPVRRDGRPGDLLGAVGVGALVDEVAEAASGPVPQPGLDQCGSRRPGGPARAATSSRSTAHPPARAWRGPSHPHPRLTLLRPPPTMLPGTLPW